MCAAAQRSRNHRRTEDGLDWQVASLYLQLFIIYTIIMSTVSEEHFIFPPAALKDYLKFNGCLPSRIIVYRDGVGDGQLHSVVNYEVAQIMDSIKSMGQDYL